MLSEIEKYDNLIIVRAFTKIFAIPGVRLGYLVSSNQRMLEKIKRHLPEWNISCLAEAAGVACTKETAFIERTVKFVESERQYLTTELEKLGFQVYPSRTNFILFYSEQEFYERLLERGIMIRDCSNYRGLKKGFYRVAVKSREDNDKLLKVLGELK